MVRVGADICCVDAVGESVAAFGDRYLRRVFTDGELAYCTKDPLLAARRLAARFAAKEATVKVLRPRGWWPDWRTIEVRRDADGRCDLLLTGSAATLAADEGVLSLAVSLSHDASYAFAVVVAEVSSTPMAVTP
jgi:holo-[acyl-carrier protein] synthase